MNCIEKMVIQTAAHTLQLNGGTRDEYTAAALQGLLPQENDAHLDCDNCSTDGDYGAGLRDEIDFGMSAQEVKQTVIDWVEEFRKRTRNDAAKKLYAAISQLGANDPGEDGEEVIGIIQEAIDILEETND